MMQHCFRTKEISKGIISFVVAVTFVFVLSQELCFLVSDTDSLPQHYFIQIRSLKPRLNDYTVVWSEWYGGKMIKKIIGVAGDRLSYDTDGSLFLNDFKLGLPQTQALDGRPLKGLSPQIIPEGHVFLYSEHPRSFDSRYEALALIPLSSLEGRVIPLG